MLPSFDELELLTSNLLKQPDNFRNGSEYVEFQIYIRLVFPDLGIPSSPRLRQYLLKASSIY